jgi:hypothetical protein
MQCAWKKKRFHEMWHCKKILFLCCLFSLNTLSRSENDVSTGSIGVPDPISAPTGNHAKDVVGEDRSLELPETVQRDEEKKKERDVKIYGEEERQNGDNEYPVGEKSAPNKKIIHRNHSPSFGRQQPPPPPREDTNHHHRRHSTDRSDSNDKDDDSSSSESDHSNRNNNGEQDDDAQNGDRHTGDGDHEFLDHAHRSNGHHKGGNFGRIRPTGRVGGFWIFLFVFIFICIVGVCIYKVSAYNGYGLPLGHPYVQEQGDAYNYNRFLSSSVSAGENTGAKGTKDSQKFASGGTSVVVVGTPYGKTRSSSNNKNQDGARASSVISKENSSPNAILGSSRITEPSAAFSSAPATTASSSSFSMYERGDNNDVEEVEMTNRPYQRALSIASQRVESQLGVDLICTNEDGADGGNGVEPMDILKYFGAQPPTSQLGLATGAVGMAGSKSSTSPILSTASKNGALGDVNFLTSMFASEEIKKRETEEEFKCS